MAELNNNNMEQNNLNEQEMAAAQAAAENAVPAAPEAPAVPEKKKFFAKGSKSRKIAGGVLVGLGTTILGATIFALGKMFGEKKTDGNVVDGEYTDVTDSAPADDTVPFDDNNF